MQRQFRYPFSQKPQERKQVAVFILIQVEDFINETSTTPLSSVPVQLLIYVLPEPSCPLAPTIMPLEECLEVGVGVNKTFDLYVYNPCASVGIGLNEIFVSKSIPGLQMTNLTVVPSNTSLSYTQMSWQPQSNQVGLQELCTTAYTE